jgi:hypothetical protein
MLPENQILQTYLAVDSLIDEQAKAEKRKQGIRYAIYAGAGLVLFAIIVYSIKKLKNK